MNNPLYINLGNGYHSQGKVYEMVKSLERAYEINSGLQQAPRTEHDDFEISYILRKIGLSLGFKIKIEKYKNDEQFNLDFLERFIQEMQK